MGIKRYDIVLFPRNKKDWVSGVLNWILRKFDPEYDQWCKENGEYWHMAPIVKINSEGMIGTLDAMKGGSKINWRTSESLSECRIYHWLDNEPEAWRGIGCAENLRGKDYDRGAYIGTVICYFIKKWFHKSYRVWDDEYHCWELTCVFMRCLWKPLVDSRTYPLINEIIEILEAKK